MSRGTREAQPSRKLLCASGIMDRVRLASLSRKAKQTDAPAQSLLRRKFKWEVLHVQPAEVTNGGAWGELGSC